MNTNGDLLIPAFSGYVTFQFYIFLSLLTILQSERKLNPGLTGRVFFISLDSAPPDLYLLANDFLNPK